MVTEEPVDTLTIEKVGTTQLLGEAIPGAGAVRANNRTTTRKAAIFRFIVISQVLAKRSGYSIEHG